MHRAGRPPCRQSLPVRCGRHQREVWFHAYALAVLCTPVAGRHVRAGDDGGRTGREESRRPRRSRQDPRDHHAEARRQAAYRRPVRTGVHLLPEDAGLDPRRGHDPGPDPDPGLGRQGCLADLAVPGPSRSGTDVRRRRQGPVRRRLDRRSAGRLESEGQHAGLPGHRGHRRHPGAQAQGHAEERRYRIRLSRPGLFPDHPHGEPDDGAWHVGEIDNRLWRLRTDQRRVFPVLLDHRRWRRRRQPAAHRAESQCKRADGRQPVRVSGWRRQRSEVMKHLVQKQLVISALAVTLSLTSVVAIAASASGAGMARFDAGAISGLGARNIGSAAMSGRIAALAAAPEKDGKLLIYVGAASGGVWKSADGGTTYTPVFDKQPVQSIGDIEIDPQHHDTVWVGTGESWTRNSVSIGDGIYKSTDGGETWTNMGLKDSERISKIIIDPDDGNIVYACAPGKLWSDSADRGLYKTRDGGKSWTLVLKGRNLSTGCSSLAMDPKNPNVLFAGMWDFRRKGWTFRSGGESPTAPSASGLFRSDDGGKSWTEITSAANKGFPVKPYGRIAVAVAPSNPSIVYSLVESPHSALYRSDDGGKTWQQRDKSQLMVWRPFYFANLIVDPHNPERLFKPDLNLIQSVDGGKSFANVGGGTHGDSHVVWIDPRDTQNVIVGDDGGLWYSKDGGNKWWKAD